MFRIAHTLLFLIAFVISKSDDARADAYDRHQSAASSLQVEFRPRQPNGEMDRRAPTVAMDAPAEGGTISDVITLNASATDNVAVQGVQFRLDSENICALDTSAPYTCNLDTTLHSDGIVALSVVAIDSAGNETVSSPVTVTIDNAVKGGGEGKPPRAKGTDRVPEDYATIQKAVNAAGDGDIILVGPGTYEGGILISDKKSITLASHHHTTDDPSFIDRTIISGGSPALYVDVSAPNMTVRGFHFVGGSKPIRVAMPSVLRTCVASREAIGVSARATTAWTSITRQAMCLSKITCSSSPATTASKFAMEITVAPSSPTPFETIPLSVVVRMAYKL